MKRLFCLVLALLCLVGCGQKTIAPAPRVESNTAAPTSIPSSAATAVPTSAPSPTATAAPTQAPATPVPTETVLPTASPNRTPKPIQEASFMEELLSQDGEPIRSQIEALLTDESLSKESFLATFDKIVQQAYALQESVIAVSAKGRTLTAARRDRTVAALQELMGEDALEALRTAYARCTGTGEDLPLQAYTDAIGALLQTVQGMEDRTVPFYRMDARGAAEYLTVLSRYMGEPVSPNSVFEALEELAQTEAYALSAALQADPEAGRKKERLSLGSYAQNMAFLCQITRELYALPDGFVLPVPAEHAEQGSMDLLELAFHQYPGMAFLKAYAAQASESVQNRWANASDGYLAGIAVHSSYAVIPYLADYGLDYVQYRWYEDMLDVTLTGMVALLIHYYGYAQQDVAAYLEVWGAESFAKYLYDEAMTDPFESLVAAYGYWRYLDICQAALDAGCDNERRFLQEYVAAGPMPFDELKEYMVRAYQNQG